MAVVGWTAVFEANPEDCWFSKGGWTDFVSPGEGKGVTRLALLELRVVML